jgi:hypothetical protein
MHRSSDCAQSLHKLRPYNMRQAKPKLRRAYQCHLACSAVKLRKPLSIQGAQKRRPEWLRVLVAACGTLNLGATGKTRAPLAVSPPVDEMRDGGYKPKQRIRQIDPDRVLHSLYSAIALRIGLDVHLWENGRVRSSVVGWQCLRRRRSENLRSQRRRTRQSTV